MKVKLKKIKTIKTSDVFYDTKLKRFCICSHSVDVINLDINYIRKHCLKLKIESYDKMEI